MSLQEEGHDGSGTEGGTVFGIPVICKVGEIVDLQGQASTNDISIKEVHCANQTDFEVKTNDFKCSSCQEFSTKFPFSYNIFVPAADSTIYQLMKSRHKLTTTYLRCRLRMGVNTFDTGCIYGKERLLRVEAQTEEELVQAIDRLDEIFPGWKVWQHGKVDSQMIR